jgi:tol-pal system protein YbgF
MRYSSIRFLVLGAIGLGLALPVTSTATAATEPDSAPLKLAQNDEASGSRSLFTLYQKMQRLQKQVRELNGEIDTLKHRIKQNQKVQSDTYEDLDNRLSKLEKDGKRDGSSADGNEDNRAQENKSRKSAGQKNDDYGSKDFQSSEGGADESEVKSAYMDGFNKLKNSHYDAAISSFKKFVSDYPDSDLADNAWYWLGEAYYVQGKPDASEKAFQTVVNRFSSSEKLPGSLYKIGLIEAAGGHTDNAKATLQRVIDQYPDSKVADLAKKKLQSMGKS